MGTALEQYVVSELDEDKKYVSDRRNFLRTLTVDEIELMQKLSQLCGAVRSSNFLIATNSATLKLSADTVTELQSKTLDARYKCASVCVQLGAAKRKRLNRFSQVFEVEDTQRLVYSYLSNDEKVDLLYEMCESRDKGMLRMLRFILDTKRDESSSSRSSRLLLNKRFKSKDIQPTMLLQICADVKGSLHASMLAYMLHTESDLGLDIRNKDDKTALILAAANGHTDIAASLIAKGANMDIQDKNGDTALMLAAMKGLTDIAASLIAKDAIMDIQAKDGSTALICAAYYDHTDIAASLIAKGANMDIQAKEGCTALIWAIKKGRTDIAASLIANSANMDIKDKYGKTALISAIENGHTDIAASLIAKDANMDIKDKNGTTALLLAAEKGNADIAALLIAKGANMDIQSKDGNTALKVATEKGHTDIAASLIANGANVDIKDKHGDTALIVAS
jgi:ankyrin repeat protein